MAEFSDWIGRSVTRIDTLTQRLADKYRATMAPFLFEEDEHTAPPGLHFGLAPATPQPDETGPDGAEMKGLFLPPIPQPRRMWAGGSITTLRPLRRGARPPHLHHRGHPLQRQQRQDVPGLDRPRDCRW